MTWAAFNEQVRVLLHVHNRRQGIQNLIDLLIKAAVLDLMSGLPQLRVRTATVASGAQIITDGYTGRISLPAGAVLREVSVQTVADPAAWMTPTRIPLSRLPEARLGQTPSTAHLYIYDPVAGSLWLSPNPTEEQTSVRLRYESLSVPTGADDATPFEMNEALAVAEYVSAKLAAVVDRDLEASQLHTQQYRIHKRRIHSDAAEADRTPKVP